MSDEAEIRGLIERWADAAHQGDLEALVADHADDIVMFDVPPPDDGVRGINRPTDLKFGPDGCAYLVDYGAVRDFGQSDPATKFVPPSDGPLVQIPGTGVIWKICPTQPANDDGEDD